MNEEERKKLSNYLENYGAYDLADEFNTQVYMVNTQEFNDLVLLYYFIQKDEIEQLQQENQQLKEEIEKLNYIINKQDRDITTISKGNKQLKSVLDEIRELSDKYEMGRFDYLIPVFEIKMKLDKVK